jgi:hypothetical protein
LFHQQLSTSCRCQQENGGSVLILRLYIVLVALLLALSGGMYIFTRNRRYLEFAWQTVRFTALLLLIIALLFVLERYVLVGWLAAL